MTLHNLNDYIHFKISERGKEIYTQHWEDIGLDDQFISVDDKGYAQLQMHEFMRIYGSHIKLTGIEFMEDMTFILESVL